MKRGASCHRSGCLRLGGMQLMPDGSGTASNKQARNKNEAVIHEVMRRSLAPAPTALLFPQRPG
jgi:hypothetical protein